MNIEKRILIASGISLLILFLFSSTQRYAGKNTPTKRNRVITSNPTAGPAMKNGDIQVQGILKKTDKQDKINLTMGNFSLTICPIGGYVEKIKINSYGDELVYRDLLYTPETEGFKFKIVQSDKSVMLSYSGQKGTIKKKIVLKDDYGIELSIFNGLDKSINKVVLTRITQDTGFNSRYQEIFYKNDDIIKRISFGKVKNKAVSYSNGIGGRDKYYAFLLFNMKNIQFLRTKEEKKSVYILSNVAINPGESISFYGFLGPQDKNLLQSHKIGWIVNYGLFNIVAIVLLKILQMFHFVVHNWGLSIILMSITVYLLLFPLTAKSFKSIKKMQELQPKIDILKAKHKDNPQKLQKETLELYKKSGVNPFGGCLPMLLQMPVFLALYQALNRSLEIKGAHFLWIKDLSKPDYFFRLAQPLPFIGDGVNILPIAMIVVMFFQQKVTAAQQSNTNPEQQKMMQIVFPLLFGFIFYKFPAGLVLYWLTNSILGFTYQYKLSRS